MGIAEDRLFVAGITRSGRGHAEDQQRKHHDAYRYDHHMRDSSSAGERSARPSGLRECLPVLDW